MSLGEVYTENHGLLGSIVAIYLASSGRRLLRRCKDAICKMAAIEPAGIQAGTHGNSGEQLAR